MKTAKGKDKANTTKEALKPVDDRKVGKGKAPTEKHRPFYWRHGLHEFKEPNPNLRSFSGLIKAKAQRWKSMSHTEKAPYEEKAAKWEAEYEKLFGAYNKNMEERSDEPEDEASDEAEHLEKVKAGDEKGDRHLCSRFSGLKIYDPFKNFRIPVQV